MTVPSERTRAVLATEKFLLELCDPKATPRIPKALRDRACALLRHYPSAYDMNRIVRKENEENDPFGGVFGGGL
jgi:hypothetical protein